MLSAIKYFIRSKPNFKILLLQDALVVDVRTPSEFATGHVVNSINLPFDNLCAGVESLKYKNIPIIVVGRSTAINVKCVKMLEVAGIKVYNGGSWRALATHIKK